MSFVVLDVAASATVGDTSAVLQALAAPPGLRQPSRHALALPWPPIRNRLADLAAAFALLLWRHSDAATLRLIIGATDGTHSVRGVLQAKIAAGDTLGSLRTGAAAAIDAFADLAAFTGAAAACWTIALVPREALSLDIAEGGDGYLCSDSGAVEPARVQALAAQMTVLLAAPDADSAAMAPLLTAAEYARVVLDWNATDATLPEVSIAELWQQQVQRTPDAIAIDDGSQALSYAALDAEARRFSRRLRAAGVTAGMIVGVCADRSIALAVALLATMQCGAIYAAFDPAQPALRRQAMVQATSPVVVVFTRRSDDTAWIGATPALFVVGDEHAPVNAAPIGSVPSPAAFTESVAYLIFTSGSTGTPKAVAGTQRGLVNRLLWMQQRFPCRPGDVVAQKTAITFIDALTETLGCLLFGGRLCIVNAADASDPSRLWQRIVAAGVQRLVLVPALLSLLIDDVPPAHALELLICSGDALPAALAHRACRRLPQTQLVNLYGSSEVAGDVTFHCVDADAPPQGVVPLGRPIANTQAYVLDAHGQPLPVGVAGELYLGGANVALCYLGASELTAEKFLPDPFRRGHRLFRSGDRVCLRDDGVIEFLGRMDRQVKVRGIRVELGEIEAALAALPGVAVAAVVFDADSGALLAYVQCVPGTPPRRAAEWRSDLRRHLPDAMLPTQIIELTALPYTSSGKLDRKALPRPDGRRGEGGYVAPRTLLETQIAALWAEQLGIDRVGVHDDFFDLGGYSLLALRLLAPLRTLTGRPVSLHDVVASPTIAGFLAGQTGDGEQPARPPGRLRWD